MPLDPRVKRFLDVLAAGHPASMTEATVEQRRRGLAELMKLAGPDTPIGAVEDRALPRPGAPLIVRSYAPLNAAPAPSPGLVYFHGGGFVAGSLATHDSIARALTHFAGCRVISVDYRLAPEHPFPAAIDDAFHAVGHIGANAGDFGIDAARLGVCGDSAGATLAAVVSQTPQHPELAQNLPLALQVLICPILDYTRMTSSKRDFAHGYLVDQATLDHDLRHYVPIGVQPSDPRISPLRAVAFSRVPRTLIHTAEFDPLRDEGRDYFERLSRAEADVSYTCHPGMIHLFYALGGVIPHARIALEQIGREIRAAWA